ncbi:YigZ family protein [Hazenella sp. IB182357]|uniref:YigZ family protein n=1 Tax=Polycladospora coralii TaxID=2771432 RepID=A0A926NBC0_9BACL|nr:YigZ family protein [Polycladospora coralii]MBD1372185.1 YigZ family protein [Polycladospora coralii]
MDPTSYFTIGSSCETEIVIQKSRFICHAKPAQTESEAQAFIKEISKKYWDAAHNCYAYRITDLIQKASDDGEPSGTAGRPMLDVCAHKQLQFTTVVITRYFGGIKLGTGGLVRAYSHGTSAVLEKAGIVQSIPLQAFTLQFSYTFMGKMEYELHQTNWYLESPQFTDHIQWVIWVPLEDIQTFESKVLIWTHGQAHFKKGRIAYKNIPLRS